MKYSLAASWPSGRAIYQLASWFRQISIISSTCDSVLAQTIDLARLMHEQSCHRTLGGQSILISGFLLFLIYRLSIYAQVFRLTACTHL